jgi:ATP-dependent Clp protease ATP-binding subunit ClpX
LEMLGRKSKPLRSGEDLRCSFCRKPQGTVKKLISNPTDDQRAYICDECIRVCYSILEHDPTQEPAEPV